MSNNSDPTTQFNLFTLLILNCKDRTLLCIALIMPSSTLLLNQYFFLLVTLFILSCLRYKKSI